MELIVPWLTCTQTESIDFALQMTRVNAIVYFLIECYHQLFE
jgi:hypothetical protein